MASPQYLPMEAVSAGSIPKGEGWQYEPKWDGFRCLAFKDGDRIELHSKSAKLLTAAFPDIADALRALKPATFVLDGELVIPVNGVLSFDHLLARFSRSGGGSRQQAAEHPAVLFVFDILADEGEELAGKPLSTRRARLERFAELYLDGDKGAIRLSPATTDIEVARKGLPGQVMTQFGHRIGEWHSLKPALVAQVQYDHFTGGRFRHGAKLCGGGQTRALG